MQEIIDAEKNMTGEGFTVIDKPRRSGGASILVADSVLAKEKLG